MIIIVGIISFANTRRQFIARNVFRCKSESINNVESTHSLPLMHRALSARSRRWQNVVVDF